MRLPKGLAHQNLRLMPNGTTGEKNEAALKRYSSFRKAADKLGHKVAYEPTMENAYRTETEIHKAIGWREMKDALGHGSDARGMASAATAGNHQAGVLRLGRPGAKIQQHDSSLIRHAVAYCDADRPCPSRCRHHKLRRSG